MAKSDTLQPSTPTFTVDGEAKAQLSDDLLSLTISENTEGLYRCEATFTNWGNKDQKIDFLYFGRDVLEFGKTLEVKVGTGTLFTGRIMAIEAHFLEGRPPEVTVLAEDRFQDLRMTRRTRTFVDSSDADVIRQIASDHGLQADVNVDGPVHKVLAQTNLSDLAFMRERARAVDAEIWMNGRTLLAKPHNNRNGGTVSLSYGNQLRAFSVSADLARQCTAVSVSGWDVSAKNGLALEAAESAIRGELNGDASGASILKSKFGERKQAVAHTVPLSSAEAKTEAEAIFRQISRRFVTGTGIAQTVPELRVGAFLDVTNVGPLFDGKYYLSESQHLFDRTAGLRTKLTVERPGLGHN
jgi:phage protein D